MDEKRVMNDLVENKDKIEIVLKQDTRVYEDEISLKEIIGSLYKGKVIIIWTVIIALLVSVGGTFAYTKYTTPYSGQVKTVISFNYIGIEDGLDPLGRKFDISKIKAPVVTSRVIENLKLDEKYNITPEDIRSNIDIEGIVPEDIVERITILKKQAEEDIEKLDEIKDITYFPTQYIITFKNNKNLGISKTVSAEILDDLVSEYEKYFIDFYADRDVLANALGEINYDEYDYPEVSRVMKNQISTIRSYLTDKMNDEKGQSFRAKETGLSFADIVSSIDVINDVDISRMDSIIGAFNLTKDKEKLITLYQYRIKVNELLKAKKEDEALLVSQMLEKYEKDKNLVYVPGLASGEAALLEQDVESNYYDVLAMRTTESGVSATDAVHDIEYYEKEIDKLINDDVPFPDKKKAEGYVVELMGVIKDKLDKWIVLTNDTVNEYYEVEVLNNAVKQLTPSQYYGVGNEKLPLIGAIGLILGLMLGCGLVLLSEYLRPGKKELEM